MGFAEIAVNSPIAQRRTFSYAIPTGMTADIGQAVLVPFGNKTLQGIVMKLTDYPAVAETKDIAGTLEPNLVLSAARISLAEWISQYYLSPLFDSVALMLPPGFERKALTLVSPSIPDDFDLSSLTPEQKQALESMDEQGKTDVRKIEKLLGKKKAQAALTQLVRQKLVVRSYELEKARAKPKLESYVSLTISLEEARYQIDALNAKRAKQQATLLDFLVQHPAPISLAEVRQGTGCTKATINTMAKKGLVTVQQIEVKRSPFDYSRVESTRPLTLTTAQETAFKAIQSSLAANNENRTSPAVFLLHGVTGSGKTEVYLQALAEAVRRGKKGIVLVPEIALTPQTIERFAARFPRRVAVLHSQLSLGEQFDEWHRIRKGEADVAIGPRSALFAPQPDLGLIVIDEEHEWTYKQQDKSPYYHARNAAIKLAELTGAVVVLGSATPDVETFYHARRGDYQLLQLRERLTPSEGSPLPKVKIIDLRDELKAGNTTMFSRALSEAISKAIDSKEQVILFLNRRGGSTFVQCRRCGFVIRCRRCDIPLTYHLVEGTLICHQCNTPVPVPQRCPRCSSPQIKFLGAGTEKLESEASHTFPSAKLLRWDSDVTQHKDAHQKILDKFRSHQADILIGTQMVAKGLDLPGVTLVGVVNADTSLHLPDFRAGERTFQLLSQVAGRAGRGPTGGQVITQTYSPEHYAIQAAANHDYSLFYQQEIAYRRQLHHPPFYRLASLIYSHTNEDACHQEAERMKHVLTEEREVRGIADVNFIGPAPAFIHRLRGRFRWQLIIRGTDPSVFLSEIDFPRGWTVNIDPVGL